ncbi:head maturation protease, ClpP-related [Vibrio coralliilyticus]|uniref:head maturation protease, ClpP-related n=1 Tax=Vibrio coralliilyticus TaxID=190893 RepID=UPI00051290B0|nr:head maturation protease, ClpP-related [Vibrio coralliilyticus]AIU67002.1 ATP-dependent protease [Vibrio coralliilyticus]
MPKQTAPTKSWYTLKNEASDKPAQLYIHGEIGGWDIYSIDLVKALQQIGDKDLMMRVQSYGGSVYEGLAMFNAIKAHKGKTIGVVDGLAASIATYMLMACDEIHMPENSTFMIHNPSIGAWGEEDEIESALTQVKNAKATVSSAYVERSGKPLEDVLSAMAQETWFTAQEALDWGLIDKVIDPVDLTNCFNERDATEIAKFKNAPESLLNRITLGTPESSTEPDLSNHTAPAEHSQPEPNQPSEQVSDMPKPNELINAVKAENQRQQAIRTLCNKHGVNDELMNTMLEDMDCTVEMASARILSNMNNDRENLQNLCNTLKLSEEQTNQVLSDPNFTMENASQSLMNIIGQQSADGGANGITPTHVHAGNGNHVKDELQNALNARCGVGKLEKDNSFGYESLLNMARASLGVNARSAMTKNDLVNRAMNTQDFGDIVTEAVRTVMRDERDASAPIWRELANVESLPDFRQTELTMVNDAPDLMNVGEDGEYKEAILKGSGERIQLATFGREIKFTRQFIINDDIGLISKVPRKFMQAGYRLADKLMFNAVLSGKMGDGGDVFKDKAQGNWGNLKTGITAGDYQALIMALHKAFATATTIPLDCKKEGDPLDLRGQILVASPDHASMLEAVLNTASKPDEFNPAYKKFGKVVETARVNSINGAMALTSKDFDTVLMGFLDGQQDPWLETGDGWSSDGAKFRITYDITSKVLDRRGIAKATFAAAS